MNTEYFPASTYFADNYFEGKCTSLQLWYVVVSPSCLKLNALIVSHSGYEHLLNH
jgi:hypothetical protein